MAEKEKYVRSKPHVNVGTRPKSVTTLTSTARGTLTM